MKKTIALLMVAVLLIFVMTGCSTAIKTAEENSGHYTAGTYTGISKNGRGGEVEVSVKFSDNEILSITVISQNETAGVADTALKQIPEDIVAYQSLAVDVVSGATITSNALIEGVSDAVEKAGGNVQSLKNVLIEKKLSDKVIELKTDLVVIGAGASGMSAAVSAAYEGAESVIVFEKTSTMGGNALVSGGWIETVGISDDKKPDNNSGYDATIDKILADGPQTEEEAKVWDKLEAEVAAWRKSGAKKVFDSNLFCLLDFSRIENVSMESYGNHVENLQIFNKWLEEFGAVWNPTVGIVGYSWPRWTSLEGYYSGQGYFKYLSNAISERDYPVDIYYNTPVESLLVDKDGNVTGVKAVADTGETYIVTADNIIIATGGYSANGKMLMEYNKMWDKMTEDVLTTNISSITGDGIIMATEVGAITEGMDMQMMFPMANINTGSTESIVGNSNSALLVNQEGERFVDETKDRFTISSAMYKQTNEMAYIISDSLNSNIKDGKTLGGEDVEALIANGELYRADTLKELAEMIGIDAETLTNTVNRYNEMCESYIDPGFGRSTFADGSEIVEKPFYAYPCVPASHITMGGIVVNKNHQVVNANRQPIKGLYAVGEVVSGELGIGLAFSWGKAVAKYIVETSK